MPRPAPQSFARTLGLQAVMWGLFVAALAGATQLSRSRAEQLRIAPLVQVKQFGWIKFAVPEDWQVHTDRSMGSVLVSEPKKNNISRLLILTQEQLDGPPDPAYLLRQLRHEVHLAPIQFAGLNVSGQMAQFTLRDEQTGAPVLEYFALAMLPDNVVLKVELRGVPGFGPIDSENFQKLIDGLQPADNPGPQVTPPRTGGRLNPI